MNNNFLEEKRDVLLKVMQQACIVQRGVARAAFRTIPLFLSWLAISLQVLAKKLTI